MTARLSIIAGAALIYLRLALLPLERPGLALAISLGVAAASGVVFILEALP
jgi:hypothetical protein